MLRPCCKSRRCISDVGKTLCAGYDVFEATLPCCRSLRYGVRVQPAPRHQSALYEALVTLPPSCFLQSCTSTTANLKGLCLLKSFRGTVRNRLPVREFSFMHATWKKQSAPYRAINLGEAGKPPSTKALPPIIANPARDRPLDVTVWTRSCQKGKTLLLCRSGYQKKQKKRL